MSTATDTETVWQAICPVTSIVPGTGVCALHDGRQVAVLRLDDAIYAIDNRDPFSGAAVLSRGIIGERDGRPYVASPIYKHRFDLLDGRCLDEPAVRLDRWALRIQRGMVELGACQRGD